MRYAAQGAVEAVTPAVIGADKAVGFAAAVFANGGGAVATAVQQDVDVAFAIAYHDDRLRSDHRGLKAARVRDFTFVSDPDPGLVKNLLDLKGENVAGGVQRGMNPVGLYQGAQRGGVVAALNIFYRNTFRHCLIS